MDGHGPSGRSHALARNDAPDYSLEFAGFCDAFLGTFPVYANAAALADFPVLGV